MKQTNKMSRAVCQLEKMFNVLNADKFGGLLPTPIITVQSKPGSYGHCTTAKVWKRKDGETYELNIAAEVLSYPIEETLDTMLHEMVHLYCRENNIKETSRGGKYHNGRFKREAERVGLTCVRAGQYGWNTAPNDGLIEYALSKGWSEIQISRGPMMEGIRVGATGTASSAPEQEQENGGKKPSSTRKYKCPCCGNSVRATKEVNIICGDCMVKMEKVEK
jgi:hypothetical protein